MNHLHVARFLPRSTEANGPGTRSVAWFAGCTLGCRGCINRRFWPRQVPGTISCTPDELAGMIPDDVEGVTLSGGEPFQQDPILLERFLRRMLHRGKSVLAFTGYTLEELRRADAPPGLQIVRRIFDRRLIDILIAGRYVETRRVSGYPLIASSNQQVHFLTGVYGPGDLHRTIEFHADLDTGRSISTGVPR